MHLNGNFLGGSFVVQTSPSFATNYNKFRVNGNLTLDKVRNLSQVLTNQQLNQLSVFDEYSWSLTTRMYAEFNDNLNAGNVTGVETDLVGFDIFRKANDETIFTKIDTLEPNEKFFTDYAVATNSTYEYIIYALTEQEVSNPITSPPITLDFYSWSLTNPKTQEVYIFDLNTTSSPITHNTDFHVYDTAYTEKPKVSYGDKNYLSGTISALAGQVLQNGLFYYPHDYLDKLSSFVNSKGPKYLKSRKGDIWIVHTSDFQFNYQDEVQEQIAMINFNFIEVGGQDGSKFI